MELTLDQALQKGVEAHKAGKVEEADRYYTAILKANPKHADANHNMGVLSISIGKTREALPFFKTALEANPSKAQFWLSYINALIKQGRMDDAKAVFHQAKSNGARGDGFDQLEQNLLFKEKVINPMPLSVRLIKAMELRESGKFEKAIALLENGIGPTVKDANFYALLSHCYILIDDLDNASSNLDKAKGLDPKIAAIGWNQTRLLLKQKKVTEALAVARKTNEFFPEDVEGMSILGSCLKANGYIDESLKYLNKVIKLDPNQAEALVNRGLIWLKQEKKSKALKDLERSHQIKPYLKQIWDLLIGLKIDARDYSSAISILINMIKISY